MGTKQKLFSSVQLVNASATVFIASFLKKIIFFVKDEITLQISLMLDACKGFHCML
jgi:hypothetical protein